MKTRPKIRAAQKALELDPSLALGNYDEAFEWFERAYEKRESILQSVKVHPFFNPVRSDPRFKDLLRRVGLN